MSLDAMVVLPCFDADDAKAAARMLAKQGWGAIVVTDPEIVAKVRAHVVAVAAAGSAVPS